MTDGNSTILLCGFAPEQAATLHRRLESHYTILLADTADAAFKLLDESEVDLAICRHDPPVLDGVDLLHDMRVSHPKVIRILAGSFTEDESFKAVHESAIYQFLPVQASPDHVELLVRRSLENQELAYRYRHLSRDLKLAENVLEKYRNSMEGDTDKGYRFGQMVYRSKQMADVCIMARKAASTALPILIQGETGTGKELMARAIHDMSERSSQSLLVQNCGGMSDELLHSELFGHKRGSFTGAISDRLGLLPAADGGTVLLDEIGDVSPKFQVSLLRFLQDGEVKPLGSDQVIRCNVRVIAACNQDLETLIETGEFRRDLYYRLNGFLLRLPALRNRTDDIAVLTDHLIDQSSGMLGKRILGVTPEVIDKLRHYHWPGNIRELENEVNRMMALTENGSYITEELLSPQIRTVQVRTEGGADVGLDLRGKSLKQKVEEIEGRIISSALVEHRWNQSKTATALGLSRVGLSNKIKRYGLAGSQAGNQFQTGSRNGE